MLDLYAGTGAVGIEALSRGAADALFVEIHRSAARLIRANLEGLAVPIHRARVLHRPVERAIAELARTNRTFDLIWADPPFESWEEGLAALVSAFDSGLTTKDTTLCLECPADADVATALPTGLVIERDLRGGASRVVMIRAR
jgi:16S rRNA (guanine966-N2)-methyltransferase